MVEDGIHDGDYLFVRKTPAAQPGDIVVALIEDEATVKRYYPEGGGGWPRVIAQGRRLFILSRL